MLSLTESLSEVNGDPGCTFGRPASTCVALETSSQDLSSFLRIAPSKLLHDASLPFILDFGYRGSWARPISFQEDMARAQ